MADAIRRYFPRGNPQSHALTMEGEREMASRLLRAVSDDVIIKNYHYIVGCVNAILIFPYLVSSRVVQQDFRQYLDGERTDQDKMMVLLRELTRCPLETWFQEFIGALSKILQYETVVEHLLKGAILQCKRNKKLYVLAALL